MPGDSPAICEGTVPLVCGDSPLKYGVYGADRVVRVADLEKTTFVLNGTGIGSFCLEQPCETSFEVRDTFGAIDPQIVYSGGTYDGVAVNFAEVSRWCL